MKALVPSGKVARAKLETKKKKVPKSTEPDPSTTHPNQYKTPQNHQISTKRILTRIPNLMKGKEKGPGAK